MPYPNIKFKLWKESHRTWTRVARSSWKKNIKISSLAASLCSELAFNPWSPLLNSHPASTLTFLCFNILGLPLKTKLWWHRCQIPCLSITELIWVFLISLKCFLHEGIDPQKAPLRDVVRVFSDRPCTILLSEQLDTLYKILPFFFHTCVQKYQHLQCSVSPIKMVNVILEPNL